MKKRITAVLLMLCCMLTLILPLAAEEPAAEETGILPPPELQNVGAAVVYNIENDRYIFEQDADKVIYPASTVKLMTAIVAIEYFDGRMDHEVTVPGGALIGVKGNAIGLKRNEVVTVEQLLWALITGCANDAANVLAWEIAGSVEAFVPLMNAKAKELGANNTLYMNPTGLHHPKMVTTARDTAIISTYALKLAPIADMSSVEKYVMEATNKVGSRTIFNKNYYFATNMEYLYIWKIPRGLNAGYTEEGGWCVSTSATRDGLTYIVVVMGAKDDGKYIYSYTEAADLIKWAFNGYAYTNVLTTSDMICEVPVRLASRVDYVTLFPSQNVELYLPTGIDTKKDIHLEWTLLEDTMTAPIREGQVAGELSITYNGTDLGTYTLVTRNSVSRNNVLYVLDVVREFLHSATFRSLLAVVVIMAAAYVAVVIFVRVRRNRRSAPPVQYRRR